MGDDFGSNDHGDSADEDGPPEPERPTNEPPPTPGERLLYALGQLYRLHHQGNLSAQPAAFDVEDLARIIGVWPELEFAVRDGSGTRYHFAGEVLFVNPADLFPWRLLSLAEFAGSQATDADAWWERRD